MKYLRKLALKKANERKLKKRDEAKKHYQEIDHHLENDEYIPQVKEDDFLKFNPEGEYIETEDGIAIINVYRNNMK